MDICTDDAQDANASLPVHVSKNLEKSKLEEKLWEWEKDNLRELKIMLSQNKSSHETRNDRLKPTTSNELEQEHTLLHIAPISGVGETTAQLREKPGSVEPSKKEERVRTNEKLDENAMDVVYQSFVPFLVGGLGFILAGLLLKQIQKMRFVCEVNFYFWNTLYPFLALCLYFQGSSRSFAEESGLIHHIFVNIALVQAQSVGISLFAALITFALNIFPMKEHEGREFEEMSLKNFLFLGSTALFAMSASCFISSAALVLIIIWSYTYAMDPDNVATPLASSLGDLLAIGAMAGIAVVYHPLASVSILVPSSVIVCFVALMPFWLFVTHLEQGAWAAARQQMPTFFLASILSSAAGVIHEYGLKSFPELSVYQPLINGASGNRAGLQCSRISSYVNTTNSDNARIVGIRLNLWNYYTSPDTESRAALFILLTSVPFYALYFIATHLIAYVFLKPLKLNILFVVGFICVAFVQTLILLYIGQILVYSLHHFRLDPDMHAIPMVTSIGDVLGACLLLCLFYVLSWGNDLVLKSSSMLEESANTTSICSFE
ncbi:unnamed protein product [Cylicocyclus nassatus]|uniref:SLC41A/MgtE integral membrane domain-containing protein n=1 Tax=Cylicocyclus nassatus TaxID=53992 RepID=A0AA36HAZ1_CYLNA|nr:unnamed protein product [Cylicocyclus nassatus]